MSAINKINNFTLNPEYDFIITFPQVISNKINTKEFLAASKATLKIIEKFDKIFLSIQYDMQCCIEKITSRYLTDKKKYSTLQDLILLDSDSNKRLISIDALNSLTRYLKMILLVLEHIIDGTKDENSSADLVAAVNNCYKESLEGHQGWMAFQLFSLGMKNAPSRYEIINSLVNNLPEKLSSVIKAMEIFTQSLRCNIMLLEKALIPLS